jgi:signal transduction histidine kinase
LAPHGPPTPARAASAWLSSGRTWLSLWSAPFCDQALLERRRQNAVALALGLFPFVVLLAGQGLREPSTFSSLPGAVVLAAGWLLRCRLLMAVLAIAWATQVAYAELGELLPVQVAARVVVFGLIAVTCRLGLHGLTYVRLARQHDMSTMLLASHAMGGSLDLARVGTEAVRVAARTLAWPGRAGVRPAALLRVTGEGTTLVAACDATGAEVPEAAGAALGAAPPALLRALASGRPSLVSTDEVPAGLREVARIDAGTAWAVARVPVAGDAFGALAVASPYPGALGRDDLRLLEAIARVAGLAVATALEHAELSELQRRLRHSFELAVEAGRSLEPADVVARTLVRVAGALDADRATLARLDGAELVVESTHRTGGGEPVADGRRFPADLVAAVPSMARALASERPVTSGPLEAEAAGRDLAAALGDGRHTLVVPMAVTPGRTCLLVLARHRGEPFAPADLARLRPLGDVALLVLRNAYLYAGVERARLDARACSERLQLAIDAAEDIGTSPELSHVLEGVLRRATALAGADRGSISRIDSGERMVVEHDHDPGGAARHTGTTWLLSGSALAAEAVRSGHPVRGGREAGLASHAIACPLMLGSQLVGIMELGRERTPFEEADLLTLQPFATLAALLLRCARLLAEARQTDRAKSSFMNLAAHELRTPLAVINGYLSMLEDGTYVLPAETGEVVATLVMKTRELEARVEELLTMAKLEIGNLPRFPTEVDVADAVRQAMDRLGPRARLEGARTEARLPDRALRVRADPGHLARILDNLLNNALAYSRPPADVTVAVRAGDGVEIVVRDHGLGISPEQHGRVFERFHRLEGDGSAVCPGLGLGLSISRELAQINEGSLRLEASSPGQGSTFVLRLPSVTAG